MGAFWPQEGREGPRCSVIWPRHARRREGLGTQRGECARRQVVASARRAKSLMRRHLLQATLPIPLSALGHRWAGKLALNEEGCPVDRILPRILLQVRVELHVTTVSFNVSTYLSPLPVYRGLRNNAPSQIWLLGACLPYFAGILCSQKATQRWRGCTCFDAHPSTRPLPQT
ncbi:hypothetical protein GQ53DRAFT_526576 [Thozetella sp. PMI_491]|nr:hypothetical protein GQ53DRAFT_526576 [Thozetella sp. PMI_491]